jgi:hypothetical protein
VSADEIKRLFADLTGQDAPLPWNDQATVVADLLTVGTGIGWTQFNEVLLLIGYDRVNRQFYQFLADGTLGIQPRASIRTIEQFREGVRRVQEMSLLFFGNLKFGFKVLSRDPEMLALRYASMEPRSVTTFSTRYEPIKPIDKIAGKDTFYLGYIIEADLKAKLQADPDNVELKATEAKRLATVDRGKKNHEAYLSSDHLDVYVATSMRAAHEYEEISRFCDAVFAHPKLRRLKLRWFDPTQAYCKDRIDKGLAEALMLKRAKCTLYLVQETDTIGKDSELASTLAQGKPVIAYVPTADRTFVEQRLSNLKKITQKDDGKLILEQIQVYDSALAWTDSKVQKWLQDPTTIDVADAKELLVTLVKKHYDKRAKILKEDHPLGIQVQLETGVANGVLVARNVLECAELTRRIVTGTLEFRIETTVSGSRCLIETITNCIYRVMTGEKMLMNAFWNFYLEPSE